MMATLYDDKLRVGQFQFENIKDYSSDDDEIFYFDVWFVTGNLTETEYEFLTELDDTTSDPFQDGDVKWEQIRDYVNGYARIIKF
jgi:hypothetical protein